VNFKFDKYYPVSGEEKAIIIAFDGPRAPFTQSPPNEKSIHAFNWPHTCLEMRPATSTITVNNIQNGTMDMEYFQKLLNDHPYEKPIYFKKQALIDGKLEKDLLISL